jgi:hypothetical protein
MQSSLGKRDEILSNTRLWTDKKKAQNESLEPTNAEFIGVKFSSRVEMSP